jgi:sugar/nucleoside kinase (ribokinase family)
MGTDGSAGRILALGELLVDLVPGMEQMRIEDAGPVVKTASGSAGIFVCAAALLGGDSGFIGKVGKDSLSKMVSETLQKQGVDASHIIVSDEGQMGLAFLEYLPEGRNYQYYRKNSIGSLLRADELDEEYIKDAFVVHFPGMLLGLTPEMRGACERLVEIAKKHGVLISFDPNLRKELMAGAEEMARIVWAIQNADIIAPTLEEGRAITGKESIGDVLRALHDMGPSLVALTMDKDGAVFSRNGEVMVAAGIDAKLVDPTGAGDTLAAALCVACREEMELRELAAFCNCAGTLAVTKQGAIGMALPTRVQVEELAESGACKVERFLLNDVI